MYQQFSRSLNLPFLENVVKGRIFVIKNKQIMYKSDVVFFIHKYPPLVDTSVEYMINLHVKSIHQTRTSDVLVLGWCE